MSDGPKRLADDEATRVDVRRPQPEPAPPVAPVITDGDHEDPPTDPHYDLESLSHVNETQRIRLDQVERRALPFKKAGGTREPDATSVLDATPAPDGTHQLPPQSEPSIEQPISNPPESPFAQSVWSQHPPAPEALNPADLPSALAPSLAPPAAAPRPDRSDHSLPILVVITAVLLALVAVLLMVM